MNVYSLGPSGFPPGTQLPQLSFGSTALHFFSEDEIQNGQIGYSVDSAGRPLVGDDDGDWKPTWRVIGFEDLCGDPIFVDIGIAEMPVYTAVHGTGHWKPTLISDTLEAFDKSLKIVAEIAVGRENSVKLDANPIAVTEANRVLDSIRDQSEF